jgi:hypothetical protein
MATGYGLDGPGYDSRQGKEVSLLHSVKTGYGAHLASYPMGTGILSPGIKGPLTSIWR